MIPSRVQVGCADGVHCPGPRDRPEVKKGGNRKGEAAAMQQHFQYYDNKAVVALHRSGSLA